jgi:DNA-binding CsgD family transcriptional regulator
LRLAQGDSHTARLLFKEAMSRCVELGDTRAIAQGLDGLACVDSTEGGGARAALVFGASAALGERSGFVLSPIFEDERERAQARCRLQLGEAAFAGLFAAGQTMSIEEAAADALGFGKSVEPPIPSPGKPPLSPREQEVALLVSHGLTNREIATRLIISERTVDAHVEHIRNKLGLRSRAHVAAWVGQDRRAV